ncbi:restriction endonuclease subunit S [Fructobacillus parabroussonetiae]|uniref:Type I restriction modification DNA specificity domain-containing protein n=1 Tax=Fructobacillus parabroussonetiae TaxID=2713174 RepID=A0ABS5QVU9_9LACO|nr:restriction endonuclease subunit S [Fructobacillus parabroussonetiae]MBS9337333.1 hypothetical protein [Fructobacillus parabroussonetiae]
MKNYWEQRKLSELASIYSGGGTPKTGVTKYWGGSLPWIQSSDLQENNLYDVNYRKWITNEGLQKSAAKLVPKNSIALVTRVGVGKLAFIGNEYSTSQDFISLSNLQVKPDFAVYLLFKLMNKLGNAAQGTSIKGVTKTELMLQQINVPANSVEQQQVGQLIKKVDKLITLHQ